MQPDLLSWRPRYPERAGYRDRTTSRENADRIEASGKAQTLRDRARQFFEEGGTATADELAEILGVAFRACQPRVVELKQQGLLEPTGERRKGSGGGSAHVWRWVKR